MIIDETFLNKIYCDDCLHLMQQMPNDFIDFVITSPPIR